MANKIEKRKGADPDNPIDRILAAERAAEARILDCRERNEARLDGARVLARRIMERANQRITAIHVRCKNSVAARSDDLWREAAFPGNDASLAAAHPGYLETAVERLAARLTGGGGDD